MKYARAEAAFRFAYPHPPAPFHPVPSAVLRRTALSASASVSPACRMSAAAPAMCGAAMLVPVLDTNTSESCAAETMRLPGAATSGLKRPPLTGPRLLEGATRSSPRSMVPRSS